MEKRIKCYLAWIDKQLEKQKDTDVNWQAEIDKHLVQISFFQHERLIHLIVTVVFALLEMMSFLCLLFVFTPGMMALTLLILVLLIPYIRHYYILENSVQKMYRQYDEMLRRRDGTEEDWLESNENPV